MDRQHGVTLIELLISLTILATLIGFSAGSWRTVISRNQLAANSNQIISLIRFARSEAVGKAPVLICARGSDCRKFGSTNGLSAILDYNNNGVWDSDDQEIAHLDFGPETQILWRSFRNQPHLRLDVRGTVYYQNGHFMLCRGDQGQKVIVSWIGKLRSERHPPSC